jgi:hypothetical protein
LDLTISTRIDSLHNILQKALSVFEGCTIYQYRQRTRKWAADGDLSFLNPSEGLQDLVPLSSMYPTVSKAAQPWRLEHFEIPEDPCCGQ